MRWSDGQIERGLQSLEGWTRANDSTLVRTYHFGDFLTGIRFVNEAARIAEVLNHHPEIHVEYTRVTLLLTTHDQQGLTELDFRSAAQYNAVFDDSFKNR
jgi:4a-hydroxytetrahydrobiopterin dehydratase